MAPRKKASKAKGKAKRPSIKLRDLEVKDAGEVRGGAASSWETMKEIRAWDANSKTFLYPENWIKP
jgi:hypothetical protein